MFRVIVRADYDDYTEAVKAASELENAVGKTNGNLEDTMIVDLEEEEEP